MIVIVKSLKSNNQGTVIKIPLRKCNWDNIRLNDGGCHNVSDAILGWSV